MKSTELRVGNWVLENGNPIQITNYTFYKDYEGLGDMDENLEPIPLTPEILEKAGFKYNAGRNTHVIKLLDDEGGERTLFIGKEPNFYWWGLQDYTLDSVKGFKIYHLHQLQNLIHALTGEELEIKLLQPAAV